MTLPLPHLLFHLAILHSRHQTVRPDMKLLFSLFSFIVISANSVAQGTLQFRVHLDGAQAVPPTTSIWACDGGFSLNGNLLGGGVIVDYYFDPVVTSLRIFEASDSASYGTPRFDMVRTYSELPEPDLGLPGIQAFEIRGAALTDADIAARGRQLVCESQHV